MKNSIRAHITVSLFSLSNFIFYQIIYIFKLIFILFYKRKFFTTNSVIIMPPQQKYVLSPKEICKFKDK